MTGYCAIGIEHSKTYQNIGTLFRSADLFDASFVFTVGAKYKQQPGDVLKSWRHMPLFNFADLNDLYAHLPHDCLLVGVEMTPDSVPIERYRHPERAVYLLGHERLGLTVEAQKRCQQMIQLPGRRSLNVAVCGSIVLYDRHVKRGST